MTIRLAFQLPAEQGEPAVELHEHWVLADGQLVDSPTRTQLLRLEREVDVTLHSRVAFILSKGARESVAVEVCHCDPCYPKGVSVTYFAVPEHGDLVQMGSARIGPGDCAQVELGASDIAVFREIDWPA